MHTANFFGRNFEIYECIIEAKRAAKRAKTRKNELKHEINTLNMLKTLFLGLTDIHRHRDVAQ